MKGKLTLGGLLVFIAYMRTLQQAAGGLMQTYGALKPVEAGLERVVEIPCRNVFARRRPRAHPI
jgi:ABC-type bacteriocin/lantibiotic exporter with double-glycine peptidase domain